MGKGDQKREWWLQGMEENSWMTEVQGKVTERQGRGKRMDGRKWRDGDYNQPSVPNYPKFMPCVYTLLMTGMTLADLMDCVHTAPEDLKCYDLLNCAVNSLGNLMPPTQECIHLHWTLSSNSVSFTLAAQDSPLTLRQR